MSDQLTVITTDMESTCIRTVVELGGKQFAIEIDVETFPKLLERIRFLFSYAPYRLAGNIMNIHNMSQWVLDEIMPVSTYRDIWVIRKVGDDEVWFASEWEDGLPNKTYKETFITDIASAENYLRHIRKVMTSYQTNTISNTVG